jgi:hypothetical protein
MQAYVVFDIHARYSGIIGLARIGQSEALLLISPAGERSQVVRVRRG